MKEAFKVCDRCDHDMSNTLFERKLVSDIEQRREIQDELEGEISYITKAIKELKERTRKQASQTKKKEQ